MGSLKSPYKTSYRSSIETIALNCLVFEKIAFLYALWRQTDEQTDRHTNEQMNSIDALRRSRCRQRRLNKNRNRVYHRRRHAAKKLSIQCYRNTTLAFGSWDMLARLYL